MKMGLIHGTGTGVLRIKEFEEGSFCCLFLFRRLDMAETHNFSNARALTTHYVFYSSLQNSSVESEKRTYDVVYGLL